MDGSRRGAFVRRLGLMRMGRRRVKKSGEREKMKVRAAMTPVQDVRRRIVCKAILPGRLVFRV